MYESISKLAPFKFPPFKIESKYPYQRSYLNLGPSRFLTNNPIEGMSYKIKSTFNLVLTFKPLYAHEAIEILILWVWIVVCLVYLITLYLY